MTKKKEPTESIYKVFITRTVEEQGWLWVKVTAQKNKTKKELIKNCALDLADSVYKEDWETIGCVKAKVTTILDLEEEFDHDVEVCRHCNKVLKTPEERTINLGEVSDCD